MKKQLVLMMLLCQTMHILSWSGSQVSGEKPVFFGKLTSQEGHTFNVTNITLGRAQAEGRIVRLYEMPRTSESTAGKDTVTISGNPYHDLTTTELDLLKVKKIAVPNPQTNWVWEKPSPEGRAPATRYVFIEVQITWKGDQTNNYLLELGTADTTNPMKVFCDSTGNTSMAPLPSSDASPMFCTGIKQTELRKKGAPFPSIKELIIEGYCYQPPANDQAVGIVKSPSKPMPAAAQGAPTMMPQKDDIVPSAVAQ